MRKTLRQVRSCQPSRIGLFLFLGGFLICAPVTEAQEGMLAQAVQDGQTVSETGGALSSRGTISQASGLLETQDSLEAIPAEEQLRQLDEREKEIEELIHFLESRDRVIEYELKRLEEELHQREKSEAILDTIRELDQQGLTARTGDLVQA